jgi:preprotein translocase subunit SecG
MSALSTLLPMAASLQGAVSTIVMILFVIVTLLLSIVILLQEGKGGGLAGAFGGAGADAFGVKAGTVNKFTSWLGALFLGLALLHSGLATAGSQPDLDVDTTPTPAITIPDDAEAPDGTLPPVEPAGTSETPDTPDK